MKRAYLKPEVYEERLNPSMKVTAGSCNAVVGDDGTLPIFPGFVLFVSAENAACTVDPDEDRYCVELAGSGSGMQLFSL